MAVEVTPPTVEDAVVVVMVVDVTAVADIQTLVAEVNEKLQDLK